MIEEPQFGGTNDNIDYVNRSESLSMSFVDNVIAYFAHRDHVFEIASKYDMSF